MRNSQKVSRRLVRNKTQKGRKRSGSALSPRGHEVGRRDELATVTKMEPLTVSETIEKVLIQGDLSSLTAPERVDYYKKVCQSLKLNPLTQPFQYIVFTENGRTKCQMYALKSCTEQLRKIHGVSIIPPFRKTMTDSMITCEVDLRDKTGRTDTASGSVPRFKIKDGTKYNLEGTDLCNADMKSETKAKRRGTLSICGLAMLDESELDTMDIVGGVTRDGRIYYHAGFEPEPNRGSAEAAKAVGERKAKAGMEGRKKELAVRNEVPAPKEQATQAPQPATPAGSPTPQAKPAATTPQTEPAKSEPPKQAARSTTGVPPANIPPAGFGDLESFEVKPNKGKMVDGVMQPSKGCHGIIKLRQNKEPFYVFANHEMPIANAKPQRLFEILQIAKGMRCVFTLKGKQLGDRTVYEVEETKQIGPLAWHEGLPVIQRDAAPEERSLFEK